MNVVRAKTDNGTEKNHCGVSVDKSVYDVNLDDYFFNKQVVA